MSNKFINKKYTQDDLRRLMNEKKSKAKVITQQHKKIDSPLAKYTENGQLTCILCKSIVRSENAWKVHINTKQHRENIIAAKELKDRIQNKTQPNKRTGNSVNTNNNVPEKRCKISEGKNEVNAINEIDQDKSNKIPNDFFDKCTTSNYFDATLNKTSIKSELINIKRINPNEIKSQNDDNEAKMDVDESLPEGFFDDPVKDAKARKQEYKDPQEEEWERFQREIKDEWSVSNAIIAGEREEATTERQLEEIDEQMLKWSRVLNMERKKDIVADRLKNRTKIQTIVSLNHSDSGESDDEIDEYIDWRAKNSKIKH